MFTAAGLSFFLADLSEVLEAVWPDWACAGRAVKPSEKASINNKAPS